MGSVSDDMSTLCFTDYHKTNDVAQAGFELTVIPYICLPSAGIIGASF